MSMLFGSEFNEEFYPPKYEVIINRQGQQKWGIALWGNSISSFNANRKQIIEIIEVLESALERAEADLAPGEPIEYTTITNAEKEVYLDLVSKTIKEYHVED